jgi:hypothetical protein
VLAVLGVVSCVAGDDDDTTNVTNISTSGQSSTTASSETSDGEASNTNASTTTSAETSGGSTGEECPASADCQDDAQCNGGMCIACICVGGMDSSGGGVCPPGEECVMTGAGGMACLAEPDHCVLSCTAMTMCPDDMSCQNGACQYDTMNPPAGTGDASYPFPVSMDPPCPNGEIAVSFGPEGYAICAPACDGMGQTAPCPQAATGNAMGACLFNPSSSAMMCG